MIHIVLPSLSKTSFLIDDHDDRPGDKRKRVREGVGRTTFVLYNRLRQVTVPPTSLLLPHESLGWWGRSSFQFKPTFPLSLFRILSSTVWYWSSSTLGRCERVSTEQTPPDTPVVLGLVKLGTVCNGWDGISWHDVTGVLTFPVWTSGVSSRGYRTTIPAHPSERRRGWEGWV